MRACVRACRISGLSSILRYSLLGCRSPLSFFPSLFLSQKACYISLSLSLSPLGLCLFLCDSFMKLDPMMALLLLPVTFFLRPFPLFFNFFLSFYTVAAVVVSVTETKNAPLMFVLTFEPEGPWSWPSRFPKREREREREGGAQSIYRPTVQRVSYLGRMLACSNSSCYCWGQAISASAPSSDSTLEWCEQGEERTRSIAVLLLGPVYTTKDLIRRRKRETLQQ